MNDKENAAFSVGDFLASAGLGRRIVQLKPEHAFFCQGTVADSIFYLQKGSREADRGFAKGKRGDDYSARPR
jgi:CRP/FNR family cyclic AMP-dependent transcriptional regulator